MRRSLQSLCLAALVVLLLPATASAALPNHLPPLGTAGNYAVLAGTTVTNSGPSWITGKVGLSPGSAVTGFPPGTSGQRDVANGAALTAKNNLVTAYNDAAGQTPFTNLPVELGGTTLTRGTYRQGTAGLTGTLILNGGGSNTGVWIFQIASTLITGAATGAEVRLINGAQPCDVFWQVGSSATLGTSTIFVGNIMALTTITMNTGATLNGRAMARNGAVNLHTNRIIQPSGCTYGVPTYVPCPAVCILPPNLGVPLDLIGEFPWLLVIGFGAGAGAIILGVSARRRRLTA